MNKLLIYGTGGHAKVVQELAVGNGWQVDYFFDDAAGVDTFKGVPVRQFEPGLLEGKPVVIAIGNNKVRKVVAERIGAAYESFIHPGALVSVSAHVGVGTVVLSGAKLQADAVIGKHVIVNIGAGVDHDAVIGDYVHIGPGCYIGGGAKIGEGVVIGPNAVVMRNTIVPDWTEVPAGAVVK